VKKLIITTLAVLVLIGQIASAEIRQEYYFFPIGSWWNPMALKLTNTNIDTWWAPPDPDCFDAFNDFKLDWVRIDLHQGGIHFWDNANFDPLDPDNTNIPDSFEAYHDGIVWATEVWDDSDYFIYMNTVGFIYDNSGNWAEYAKVNDVGLGNMTICDADCINIAETSFGKIKAYFADK